MTDETQIVQADKQYAEMRREMRPIIVEICQELKLPVPQPFTRQEQIMVKWMKQRTDFIEQIVRHHEDRKMLPRLVEELIEANSARRSQWRENVRHWTSMIVGGAASFISEAAITIGEAILEAVLFALSRMAVIFVPGLVVFLLCLWLQTLNFKEPINLDIISQMMVNAVWRGVLASFVAFVAYATWLAVQRHRVSKAAGADGDAPGAVVIRRAGEE